MKFRKRNIVTSDIGNNHLSNLRAQTPDIVENQLKTKFDTFLKWDARSYLRSQKT